MNHRHKKRSILGYVFFCFLFLFILVGCKAVDKPEEADEPVETGLQTMDIPVEDFRQVVGWLNKEEILVHISHDQKEQLVRFNLFTGDMRTVYESESYFLYVGLSPNKRQILLQLTEGEKAKALVLSIQGDLVQERELATQGYVSADWNPDDANLILLSYYYFEEGEEEEVIVENWNLEENTAEMISSPTLELKWYSSNLFLYVDHGEDVSLNEGALFIGDIRTNEKWRINNDVSDFYLYEDTFIGFTPSDFEDDKLLMTHEYPFMVEQGFMTIPKASMNDRLVFPTISQGKRNGKIYGVIPSESVKLEEETGSYELVYIDFESQSITPIIEVPDLAPLAVSEDELYSLFGWQFEYVIDLEKNTLHYLLKEVS